MATPSERASSVPLLVKRSLQRLSPARKQAARDVLRGVRALASGQAGTPARVTAPKARKRARSGGDDVPGRWIRVVAEHPGTGTVLDREGSDPLEAAMVRAGWQLIDAYERLSTAGAQQVFQHELQAWFGYARDELRELKHPADFSLKQYETETNRLRFRRILDFTRPGDRIFDVGCGRGYLAGLLLRDADVAAYHGIDLDQVRIDIARNVLATNRLADGPATFECRNLYDLDPAAVVATEPSFVTCCEVLEHVDDPEAALKVLASLLPEGADLLFSVPLHGRLETILGHRTVFDVARAKDMLDAAGLYAHHVEPLGNTWTIVVASRVATPSARVRDAAVRPPVRVAVPLTRHRDFVDVPVTAFAPLGDGTFREVSDQRQVRCQIDGGGTGGVSFPVDGVEAIRLSMTWADLTHVEQFTVTAYAGATVAASWTWNVPDGARRKQRRERFALRPGESGRFVSGPHRDLEQADRVEVVATVAAGESAYFSLMVAYLP